MGQKLDIAFALDSGYLQPTLLAATSVLRSTSQEGSVHFHLLCDGIPLKLRERAERVLKSFGDHVSLTWIDVPETLASVFVGNYRWPRTTFFRLLMPDLLPPDVAKVVYLDGDVIVHGDLIHLLQQLGDGYDLHGAADARWPTVGHRVAEFCQPRSETGPWQDVPEDRPYLNAGVLVFDLVRWRERGLARKVIDIWQKNIDFCPVVDQDAIQLSPAVMALLHPKWNIQMGVPGHLQFTQSDATYFTHTGVEFEELTRDPGIIHFAGNRPWGGFVPGRAGSKGTAEWFYWQALRASRIHSHSELAVIRTQLAVRGVIRFVREQRHRRRRNKRL